MPDSTHSSATEADTAALAASIAAKSRPGDAILLAGPLGAGKTTFARAFIRALAGDENLEIPSPTFTLVQTYDTGATKIWHFDLWRLDSHHALEELAWDEAQSGIALVEWPDRLGPLAPAQALRITLTLQPQGRSITISGPARWFDAP
jgi:tRNA threonylcarbamoyladenosine biosynthesis protein TsaE